MCIYSNYVAETDRRNAKVGENLTRGEIHQHACLLGDDGKVTCVKHGTTLVIDNVDFVSALGQGTLRLLKDVTGTSITVMLLRSMKGFSADRFELPNGQIATLEWIAPGTTFRIPRKVRKDAGIKRPRNLEKALGLDQIRADVPVTAELVTVKD